MRTTLRRSRSRDRRVVVVVCCGLFCTSCTVTLLPRHVPQPTRVRRDKDDHRQQHDRGPGLGVLCTRDEDIACMFGHD